MGEVDSIRIVKDHLDIVLIVVAAYALASWLVFDHLQAPLFDEHDELGNVDIQDAHRKRAIKEAERQQSLQV